MALPKGRSIVWAIYAVALVLLVSPLVDLIGAIWPPRMGEVSWRFGAFGLTTGALVSPILGLAMLKVAGVLLEHRAVVRTVAAIDLILLLVLLGGLAFPGKGAAQHSGQEEGLIVGMPPGQAPPKLL